MKAIMLIMVGIFFGILFSAVVVTLDKPKQPEKVHPVEIVPHKLDCSEGFTLRYSKCERDDSIPLTA